MTSEQFEQVLQERLSKIKSVLGSKAKEYAGKGTDRLHNFKVAGRTNNESTPKALWGMASKHLVSIIDIVNEEIPSTPELVNEKIGDMINYLILLEAVYKEEQLIQKPTPSTVTWAPDMLYS